MQQSLNLDRLNDPSALAVLSRVGLELRGSLPEEQAGLVQGEEEARELVSAVAAQLAGELNRAEPVTSLPPSIHAGAVARQILGVLALDPGLQPRLETLIAHPPRGEEKELEPEAAVPVALDTVAAWLQTRLQVEETDEGYQVDLSRRKTGLEVIEAVIRAMLEILAKLGYGKFRL